jgi:hypothetical protein
MEVNEEQLPLNISITGFITANVTTDILFLFEEGINLNQISSSAEPVQAGTDDAVAPAVVVTTVGPQELTMVPGITSSAPVQLSFTGIV